MRRKACTQNIKSDITFVLTHLNKRSQQNSYFYYDNIYLKTEAKTTTPKQPSIAPGAGMNAPIVWVIRVINPGIMLWMDALVLINLNPETETGLWLPNLDLPVPVSLVSRGRFGFLSDGEQPAP